MLTMTNEMSDLVVIGGAKQYVLSCRMPLNKTHPPGVASQSLPGLGEVLLDPTNRDVPDLHLWTHVPNCEDLEGKGQREFAEPCSQYNPPSTTRCSDRQTGST